VTPPAVNNLVGIALSQHTDRFGDRWRAALAAPAFVRLQEHRMAAKTDIEAISDDITALKRDLAALVDHVKSGARASASGAASQLSDEAANLYGRLAAEGASSAKKISRQVEEQPVVSLLVAFALGFVGSRLLAR
jgi:hypothetical protein